MSSPLYTGFLNSLASSGQLARCLDKKRSPKAGGRRLRFQGVFGAWCQRFVEVSSCLYVVFSEGAPSSVSVSSFNTKKGFQFNPHANAFTPSTPSPHTTAATLCTPSSGSLHASTYAGPHRPQSSLGVPPVQTGVGHVSPQMHPAGSGIVTLPVVGVPGFAAPQSRAGGLPTTPRLAATAGGSSAPGLVVLAGGGRSADASLPPQQQQPPQNAPLSSLTQPAGSEQIVGKPAQALQTPGGVSNHNRAGLVAGQSSSQVQAFPSFASGQAAAGLPLAHWAGGAGVGGLGVPTSQPPHGAGAPGVPPPGGSSHGLGGAGPAVLSDPPSQAAGALAGGLMAPGAGGALLPDGISAAAVPLGVAGFALNNTMAVGQRIPSVPLPFLFVASAVTLRW